MPPINSPTIDGQTEKPQVSQAKEDLAKRLRVQTSDIELLKFEAVTWPDSSLGCPQPGMAYAEVLTPGYLIILTTNNIEYEYHASKGTEVIYCENPGPPVAGMPGDT